MSASDIKSKLRIAEDSRTAFSDTLLQMDSYIDFVEDMLRDYLDAASKLQSGKPPSDGSNDKLAAQVKAELMYSSAIKNLFYENFTKKKLTFDQLKNEVKMLNAALRDNNLNEPLGSSGTDLGTKQHTQPPIGPTKPPQESKKPKQDPVDDYDNMSPEELQRLIDEMEKKEKQERADKAARSQAQQRPAAPEYDYESGNYSPRSIPHNHPTKPAENPPKHRPQAGLPGPNQHHDRDTFGHGYGDKHHSLQPPKNTAPQQADNPFKPHGSHSLAPRDNHSPGASSLGYGGQSGFNYPNNNLPAFRADPRGEQHPQHHPQGKVDSSSKSALSPFGEQLMRGITAILEIKSKKEQQKVEIGGLFGAGILDKMVSEDNRQQLDSDRMNKLQLLLIRDENQLEKLKVDNESLRESEHQFKGRLTGMKNLNHLIRADVATISEVIESKDQEKTLLKKDIEMLEQELASIEREIAQTQSIVDSQQDPYLDLRLQKAKYRKELQLLDIDIHRFKSGYDSLKRRWDDELKGLHRRSDLENSPHQSGPTNNHSLYSEADFSRRKLDYTRDNLNDSFSRILERNERSVSPAHSSLHVKRSNSPFEAYQPDSLNYLSDYRPLSHQPASADDSYRQSTSYADRYLSKDFKRHY